MPPERQATRRLCKPCRHSLSLGNDPIDSAEVLIFRALARRLYERGKRRRINPRLIGHSHSQQIFDAAATAGFQLEGYNFWTAPQPAIAPDGSAFHPVIADCLRDGVVFSAVGGAGHNMIGLVRHPIPFDFVLSEQPALPTDHEASVIPEAAIMAAMMQQLQEYLDIITLVRAAASGPVYHFEPPPPLEDSDRVLADVPWSFFQNLTAEVSPAILRYKLWRLATRLVADHCAAIGVVFIEAPAGAVDERGYLKQEFYADAMHVNEAYGALVVEQMRALI